MTSPYLNIIKKMRTAKELFAELNSFDENRRIEAKSASAVGKSMMETVCAFANEPGLCGGYLLLGAKRTGIAEDGRPIYELENIENTDKIQSDFVAMCNSMSVFARLLMWKNIWVRLL